MKIILLDGREMTDRNTLHTYLKEKLFLPDYYGKNLDALYDCLTSDFSEKKILLVHTTEMQENLGNGGQALLNVFKTAAKENQALHIIIEG
ncbi:barstar family protein [Pisciglobus halotolerans]|uniref:Ribonuclease inhibitor n=1 Tax=Pisciglobus halotolerans TaxID=745365 RepID=A0A1I3CNZ7_9LACT|nr:barstar family protein [Pisciglobus halotolerans]SFH76056.1 ribonuclease inhibitor [Pisciglobus halotolerans]